MAGEHSKPIRDPAMIVGIKEFFQADSERNRMKFVFGINTGYRIQDMLNI